MDRVPTAPDTSGTLPVPGARLYHEVRGEGPLMVLVGSPMSAVSFEPLAALLAADHTVLTTDPRGIGRSPLDDPEQDSGPDLRADDLARLITHLDRGPATVLGSSGGAVTALALAQNRPDLVDTVVAHEPPLEELLEDRDELHAQTEKMIAVYRSGDVVGAWRLFMSVSDIPVPDTALQEMFGGDRDPQQVADERRFFEHELRPTTHWSPDLDALRAARTRVVVGIGEDSAGQLCDRTSRALATGLDTEPVLFPGDHTGFVERAEDFEPRLREVLGRA
ncbi:alpha/beta fold hydrolase [Nocardiopsis sp. FIRDI 009]|uniref:alpha/beta fold hydrolase n=1 Tax=Nocardiopsis sp. FIRDI 009 TaxID=714197 RepID=UPI000E22AFEC|nr:alpha/beta hydrolase [Nocardiopsis sp. FIRDI 009]